MLKQPIKIASKSNQEIVLDVIPGHFATNHSHINYYMDMTKLKVSQKEANEVAKTLAADYQYSTPIDCIVCMDSCNVIGTLLAERLTEAGVVSMNKDASIFVIEPEYNTNGQMIFRDNLQPAIRDKNILLLLASATTGKTISRSLECIKYYGGVIQGVSAIFSAVDSINGYNINSIFDASDFDEYQSFKQADCPYCQAGQRIDAIVNSYGYTAL